MSFQDNGFLGEEINVYIKENSTDNHLLDISYDINSFLNINLDKLLMDEYSNEDIFMVGLAVKSLQTFQSIVILSRFGLESDSKVLLRVLVEGIIHIGCIINDENYFEEYLKKSDSQAASIINNIKRERYSKYFMNETIEKVKKEDFSELFDIVKSSDKSYKYLSDIAEKAGMLNIYLYVYGVLSDYVHVNANIITRYIDFNDGALVGFNNVPTNKDQIYILVTANFAIIKMIEFLNKKYSLGFDGDIKKFANLINPYFSGS